MMRDIHKAVKTPEAKRETQKMRLKFCVLIGRKERADGSLVNFSHFVHCSFVCDLVVLI